MHIDDLVLRIRQLPIVKRKKLDEIVRLLEESQQGVAVEAAPRTTLRPVRGLLRDLGQAPSGDEIDEARRELWIGSPREDLP